MESITVLARTAGVSKTEFARQYFKNNGYELCDEYKGTISPMKCVCPKGHSVAISWNKFTQGRRCRHCAKTGLAKKRTVEQVREVFAARGCEFLDDHFDGNQAKHRYRCKCGNEAKITFGAFHFQEQYCRECGLKQLRKENHPAWIPDREDHRRRQLFRKKCHKALGSTLAAQGRKKVGKTTQLLGYSPKQLREHIESHPNWPSVKDETWHLDHIFPIKAFLDFGITDIALINCLGNLQPLLGKQNRSKWAKYDRASFEKWLADRTGNGG